MASTYRASITPMNLCEAIQRMATAPDTLRIRPSAWSGEGVAIAFSEPSIPQISKLTIVPGDGRRLTPDLTASEICSMWECLTVHELAKEWRHGRI